MKLYTGRDVGREEVKLITQKRCRINFSEIPPKFKCGKKHILFKVSISDTFIDCKAK